MIRIPEPGLLAFFVPWPKPDETISSIFDRIGGVYHIDRDGLLASMVSACGFEPLNAYHMDWDDPPETVVRVLEHTLGLRAGALDGNRIEDGPRWLRPGKRRSYCPACMKSDLEAGDAPYFRPQWAKVFATICQLHRVPLNIWPLPVWTWHGRRMPSDWDSADGQSLLRHEPPGWPGTPLAEALSDYEVEFDQAVETAGDLTGHPERRTRDAAKLMLHAGLFAYPHWTRGSAGRGKPIAGLLLPRSAGWVLSSHGPETQIAAGPESGWLRFRRISAPGERRAVILVTGVSLNWGLPLGSLEHSTAWDRDVTDLRRRVLWPRTRLMQTTWRRPEAGE